MSLQRLLAKLIATKRQSRRLKKPSLPSAAIQQLEARALLTTNLALFQNVVADSVHQDHAPEEAIDGIVSLESRWASADTAGPHWLEVQLQAPYPVGAAQVYLGDGWGNNVGDFEVQYHDGYQWQTAASVTGDSSMEHNLVFANTVDAATRYRLYTTDGQLTVREFVLLPPNGGNPHSVGTGVDLNLASRYVTEVTSTLGTNYPGNAVDGYVSDDSKWVPSDASGTHEMELRFQQRQGVGSLHLYTGNADGSNHLENFVVEFYHPSEEYRAIPPGSTVSSGSISNGVVTGVTSGEVVINFGWSVSADRIRVSSADTNVVIREAVVLPPNNGVGYPIGTSVQFASPPTTQYTEFGDKWHQLVSRQNSRALVADENGASQSAAPVGDVHKYQLLYSYTLDAYRIRSKESGLALQVKDASQAAGAAIIEGEYSAAPHQLWKLEPTDNGHVQIVNAWSGMVLHTDGSDPGVVTQQLFDAAANPANNVEWQVDFVENYFKKGAASKNNGRFGTSWWYNWGRGDFPEAPDDQFFAPMQWGPWNQNTLHQRHDDWNSDLKPSYLLGFNEPDSANQANMSVESAIEIWPQLQALGVPLLSPAATQNGHGRTWHTEFTDQADALGYRQDYAGMHWYGSPNVNNILNYVNTISNLAHGRDVWITEFSPVDWSGGSGNWSEETNYNFILEFVYRADRKENIDKYSMFMWAGDQPATPWEKSNPRANTFITDYQGELTPYGKAYAGWDGKSDPELDTLYIIHNRAATHRLQNDGSDDVGKASIRFDDTSVQWIVQDAGNDEVFITSPIDGRRLKLDNGNIVMSDAGATDEGVRWTIQQDQYGWHNIVHSGTGNHLRLNRINNSSGAPTSMTLDVVSPTTNNNTDWWFVKPYQELGLTLDSTSIAEDGTATATLSTTLVTGVDTVVTLSVDDDSAVGVPASVTIPAGQSSVTFTVSAVDDDLVDGTQSTFMTADAVNFQHAIAAIDVTDDDVAELVLVIAADEINENGGTSQATVTRNSDLASELVVALSSSDTTEATVPETVTIPAGATSVTFDIDAVDDMFADGTQSVTISVSASGYTASSDTIEVNDDETAELTLTVTESSIEENGGTSRAAVSRNTDTASLLVVNLSSNDTTEATVPESVTIPAGASSVTFDIIALDDAIADGTQSVMISASANGHFNSNDTIEVLDDDTPALTLAITTASMSENGAASQATVTRNTDTTAALVVDLLSSDTSEATVPASVTIPAGTTSVTFEITAQDDGIADGIQSVTISASANAHAASDSTIHVNDDDAAELTLNVAQASISENGGVSEATVSRNTTTAEALVVNLSSNDSSEASVPTSVTILAGQTSVVFSIDAVADEIVDGEQSVAITATAAAHRAASDSVIVTDDDVAILTLSLTSRTIHENGGTAQATVTRNTSTTEPLVVTLDSDDSSEATVPQAVTIAAGEYSAGFQITAIDDGIVDGTQSVIVTATADQHGSANATIEVIDHDVAELSLEIALDAISEDGGVAEATIFRNTDTSEPLIINLSSDDASEAVVPETVTLAAGQNSATFLVNGMQDMVVDGDQSITVAASTQGFVSASSSIVVQDSDIPSLFLSIDSASVAEDGLVTVVVSRNTTTLNDLDVTLTSSDEEEAVVPVSTRIPAGASSVAFEVAGFDDEIADGDQVVTLSASSDGYLPGAADIEVLDIGLPSSFVVTGPIGSIKDQRPLVEWSVVEDAVSYDLYINIDNGGGTVLTELGLSAPFFRVTADLEFARYRIFVEANFADGSKRNLDRGHTFVVNVAPTVKRIGATIESHPEFHWDRVPGASEYFIYINRPGAPVIETVTDPGLGTEVQHTIGVSLPRNDYRWWVRPIRLVSDERFFGAWSDRSEFSTGGRTRLIPPSSDYVVTTSIPNLQWDAVADAVSYEIYVARSQEPGVVYRDSGITSPSIQSRVLDDGSYTVWIKTTRSDGSNVWGSGVTFSVETDVNDLSVDALAPEGPSFNTRPDFRWSSVEQATSYEVYLHNGVSSQMFSGIDTTVFRPQSPLASGTWEWSVRPVSEQGVGQWSTPTSFNTNGLTTLSTVVSGSGQNLTFRWQPVIGAIRYVLQVDNLTTGDSRVIREDELTAPSFTPDAALEPGTYRAWVRAIGSNATSPWSQQIDFFVTGA